LNEQWLPVHGWPDYEISDHGRCRSVERHVDGKLDGSGRPSRRRLAGKMLTPVIRDNGLVCFNLWRGNDYRQFAARHLVLSAFERPQPHGMRAVNKDGDLSNNHLDNLAWHYSRRVGELVRLMGAGG
jgi:hypothetical protein